MGAKRKKSAESLLENLRGKQTYNHETSQDLSQQNCDDQLDTQLTNENITPTVSDGNLYPYSSVNETASKRRKEEPLLVTIKDTSTGEIITQKMQPDHVWNLKKGQKVIVQLDGHGQGSDNGANLLVRFLGKLSKKAIFCPISVERWDRMPEAKTRLQWQIIEENFEFDYAAGIKWVIHNLSEKWRACKYKLRCERFYPNKTKEEILANCPSDIDSNDWTAFVHHYTDLKMKNQSLQNVKNCKNLIVSHAGGSKSNARRAHEMEETLGRPVCRGEVVLSTLIKKDGNYVNEEGKALADKIKEHLPQDQEDAATLGVAHKILAHPNDAIGKAHGVEHSGRTRGLSGRVCPSVAFGIHRSSTLHVNFGGSSNNISQPRVDDLEKEVETLKEKLIGYEETKEKLAKNQNHLAVLHQFLQAKFGSELPTLD